VHLGHVRLLILNIHKNALHTVPCACLCAEGFCLGRRLGISSDNEESVGVPVRDSIGEVIIEAFGYINGSGDDGDFGAAGASLALFYLVHSESDTNMRRYNR